MWIDDDGFDIRWHVRRAVGRYLEAGGAVPGKPLVALVPVSVRREGEQGGNQISAVSSTCPPA